VSSALWGAFRTLPDFLLNQGQKRFTLAVLTDACNLDRRVEAITPVEDPDIAKDLQEIPLCWQIIAKLEPDGRYIQRRPADECPPASSQQILNGATLSWHSVKYTDHLSPITSCNKCT